jgi:hypothetical protein
MLVINIEEAIEARKAKLSEVPEITISVLPYRVEEAKPVAKAKAAYSPAEHVEEEKSKSTLLVGLHNDMAKLKRERGKLSTMIAPMVHRGATQADLQDQYHRINGLTLQMTQIYRSIQYVERYGKLPETTQEHTVDPNDVYGLREKKKQLINLRHKLSKKLQPNAKRPINSDRYNLWQLQLEQYNLEYQAVIDKLKRLNDE